MRLKVCAWRGCSRRKRSTNGLTEVIMTSERYFTLRYLNIRFRNWKLGFRYEKHTTFRFRLKFRKLFPNHRFHCESRSLFLKYEELLDCFRPVPQSIGTILNWTWTIFACRGLSQHVRKANHNSALVHVGRIVFFDPTAEEVENNNELFSEIFELFHCQLKIFSLLRKRVVVVYVRLALVAAKR